MTEQIQRQWAKNLPEDEKAALLLARHERDRENARKYAQKNKIRTAARKYGVTEQFLLDLITESDGKCAICEGKLGEKLYIDHDHVTNKVRKLLCSNCNNGLGQFKDSRYLLKKAANYLAEHDANSFFDA